MPDHPYVQSATLNEKSLSRAWIRHSEIAAGGILEFVMGAEPNKQWRMAPLGQYLMERNAEIALASSAAPESISRWDFNLLD
jgi:putative alpha-1,2-mannosidase